MSCSLFLMNPLSIGIFFGSLEKSLKVLKRKIDLTSQLFSNIYMNRFDQFIKHKLKMNHYIRYADDFIFLSQDKQILESVIPFIRSFFLFDLHLTLHPNKIFLKTIASGMDYLGWVHFNDHRILRSVTKRRMLKRVAEHPTDETIASYLGLMSHGNTKKLLQSLIFLDLIKVNTIDAEAIGR